MTQPQGIWMDTSRLGLGEPPAPPLSEAFHRDAQRIIARYPQDQERSALLPLLFLAQAEHGYVSNQGIAEIAKVLGLTKAEVAAVATFYTMFKRAPQGRWLISICTQPSCSLNGGAAIKEALETECGISCGGTTDDRVLSLEDVECLCACDGAPVVSINYENYERMTAEEWVELVRRLRAGDQPPAGARGEVPGDFAEVNRRMAGLDGPWPTVRNGSGG